jgi:hypothetical protein
MINNFYQGTSLHQMYKAPDTRIIPSNGWTLSISLRGSQSLDKDLTSDEIHDIFYIDFTTTDTLILEPGIYFYQIKATDGTNVEIIETGEVKVLENIALSTAPIDTRSMVKKTLDAIDATLLGRATNDQLRYAIAGRTLEKTPITELLMLKDKYAMLYQRELQAQAKKKGINKNKIQMRFK